MKDFILQEGQTAPFEKMTDEEMTKCIKHFEHELVGIRSGRAHPSMVENLKISCYGGTSELPLKNLASVSTPEPRTLLIQPWDQSIIADIERAIQDSELGMTPLNDGNVVRLQLPEMSADRREEMIKILGKKLEETRVGVRNVRKNIHNLIRDQEKDKVVSEDFAKRLNDLLQKVTDRFIKKAEELSAKKESELKM